VQSRGGDKAAELRAAIAGTKRPAHAVEKSKELTEWELGHVRVSDPSWPCNRCGLIRLEELVNITFEGGRTWLIQKCTCQKKTESNS